MDIKTSIIIGIVVFCIGLRYVHASTGDRSQFFQNCMKGCIHSNCTEGSCLNISSSWKLNWKLKKMFDFFSDAINFQEHIKQDFSNEVLLWTCHDECIYHCMWRTTNTFVSRDWPVPQFYGKWPFVRFFGIQEPASVFFSFLNLIAHWRMIRKFRNEVRNDSPMYYIWHIFSGVRIQHCMLKHF